jgi:hypothetical protein
MSTRFAAGTRKTKKAARKAAARPAFSRPAAPGGLWLSIADAALHLGVSPTTVRRRANAGDLPKRNATVGKHVEVFVTT